jgi:DNA-binding CsgD family transcriptional regulator
MNAAGPICLILTNHPTGGWCYQVDERHKVIGRAEDVDIPVPKRFRSVSRKHAEIWRDHRGCWILDLGSRQGTRVNLIWIDRLPAAKLVAGDLIRLGDDLEIQVVSGKAPDDQADIVAINAPHDSASGDATVFAQSPAPPRKILRERISPAETEVMLWISRGFLDNEELGRLLHRSPHTVRTQVNSILQKLSLHNRGDIVGWLKRNDSGKKLSER